MKLWVAGAIGGLVATAPMTAIMTGLFYKLPRQQRYPLPPREITEDVLARLPIEEPQREPALTGLTLAAHFSYGAAAGALFPLLFGRVQRPLVLGGSYGLAVWVASYLGWLPAARILQPATRHPAKRNALMLCAHWIWGATTALTAEGMLRRSPSRLTQRRGN